SVDQARRPGVVRREDLDGELFFRGGIELCRAGCAPVGELFLGPVLEVGAGAVRAPVPDLAAGGFFDAVDPSGGQDALVIADHSKVTDFDVAAVGNGVVVHV